MLILTKYSSIPKTGLLMLVAIILLNFQNSNALTLSKSTFDEFYHFRKVTGEYIENTSWHLRKGDSLVLTYSSPGEHHVTMTSMRYDTIRWTVLNKDEQTDLMAQRYDDIIVIKGRFKGQPIEKTLTIDSGPWYQATSLSLRDLIASDDTERIFWTIRYDTLTAHRIRAVKQSQETVQMVGNQLSLIHIRLTLPGMLAPLWKSNYWFSLPDGVFFRFEGPSGPPGMPKTTVTRVAD
jgi:hypothetical protein